MTDILIPPDIVPQEESIELVDDSTSVFRPSLAPGNTQRAQQAEPRLKVTQTWKSLRLEDKARMMAALGQLKGRYNSLRALVGYARRGSFPATELLSNNTFANGTTGWGAAGDATIAVSDRLMKVTRNATTTGSSQVRQTATYSAIYRPYAARAAVQAGRGNTTFVLYIDDSTNSVNQSAVGSGQRIIAIVPEASTSGLFSLYESSSTGPLAGDYFITPWTSLTQCLLVDNGQNLLTYSDQFDNAAWTKTAVTINANDSGTVAPDGTQTEDNIVETTAASAHYVTQSATCSSAAIDICITVALKTLGRNYCWLQLSEAIGSTSIAQYFNLSTGAIATQGTAGANWANVRAFSKPLGNGWYQFTLIARKTNTATNITAFIGSAIADATSSYTGNTGFGMYNWRATLAQSSVPVRLVQTTSAASTGTSQTGNALYVKGGPASATASLQLEDPVEINGELKMLTASLDFDAAGLGYLQFSPALVRSPADNDPVIIGQPLGKFMLSENPKWTNQYGKYADLTLTFEHIYE